MRRRFWLPLPRAENRLCEKAPCSYAGDMNPWLCPSVAARLSGWHGSTAYIILLVVAASCAAFGQSKTNHWSFQPLLRPTPPKVAAGDGVFRVFRNDIDRFILAELTKRGLTLSPEANRRTLIR